MRRWRVPLWCYACGLIGAVFGVTAAEVISVMRAALFAAAACAGRLLAGLLVDHYAVAGGERAAITRTRFMVCALAFASVLLTQLSELQWGDILAVLAAFCTAGLSAVRGAAVVRIKTAAQDAYASTFINYLGGWCVLTIAVLAVSVHQQHLPIPPLHVWPSEVWMYAGMCVGVVFIVYLGSAVSTLGVVRVFLIVEAVQLLLSVVFDAFLLSHIPGGAFTLLGVVGVLGAVVLSAQKQGVAS